MALSAALAQFAATYVHAQGNPPQRLPILVYHEVQADESGPTKVEAVRLSWFKQQMRYLNDQGYTTLTLREVEEFISGKKAVAGKVVALHFDDGLVSLNEVIPVLADYKFNASFAIVPGMVGYHPAMNWAGVLKIAANPRYDMLSHTMGHNCQMFDKFDGKPGKNTEKVELDLSESRRVLSEKLGKPVTALVWPCQAPKNPAILTLASKLGYTSIFGLGNRTNGFGEKNQLNIYRIPISGHCGLNDFARMLSIGAGSICAPSKAQ